MAANGTDQSILDGLSDMDLLKQIRSDMRKEWQGDEPGINFFLLLAALLLFATWVVFSVYFFSRVAGILIGVLLKRLLMLTYGGAADRPRHFSLGAFSVSLLAGKIMFRDVLYVTDDFSARVNDGYVIFSFWRRVPKKEELSKTRDKKHGDTSRLYISLNGVKVHFYNRFDVYQAFARASTGAAAPATQLHHQGDAAPTAAAKEGNENGKGAFSHLTRKVDEQQLEEWWDKFWRLVGAIVLDVSSCRVIAGNHRLPHAFALVFEHFQSKLYITGASNPEDRHMFSMKAALENVRVSLVKQQGYKERREEPPRTMGDGFAILQSATIHFFYYQDVLGLVKSEARQSATTNLPVWETIWRLDKNTVISYGPWADKQRAQLYGFFFPSDYRIVPRTELPARGQRRVFIQHEMRVSFIRDATIDFWFMRNDELNAVHCRIKPGSNFECTIPWICGEHGYQSVTKGILLKLEATTSLPFRDFISCETARFSLVADFPRNYNAHQTWNFGLELHRISAFLLWDHKRFLCDLIDEWCADGVADLCRFVPYTWHFSLNIVDQFEVILLLNDKNWVDTGATQTAENTQLAIVGNQLCISFSLPFVQFSPRTVHVDYEIKAFSELAVRVRLPAQSTAEPLFVALHNSAASRTRMKCSKVFVTAGPEQGFLEIWRTDSISIRFGHTYHPVPCKLRSDIPDALVAQFLPKPVDHPSQLAPDDLQVEVKIGESEILLSGLLIRLVFDLKDNYFGSYDQISDVNADKTHTTLKMTSTAAVDSRAELYRTMNCKLRVQLDNIQAHCLTFSSKTDDEQPDVCPVLFSEQLAVELAKTHADCLVQVQVAPAVAHFPPARNRANMSAFMQDAQQPPPDSAADWLKLDGLQFRGHGLYSDLGVPWAVEMLEYAWLTETVVGTLKGRLQPASLVTLSHFVESFLTLALLPDESQRLPEQYNQCQHFENVRTCSHSNLQNVDPNDRRVKCFSGDTLKYKLARVSVDAVDLVLTAAPHVLNLTAGGARLAFCNAHHGAPFENVHVALDNLQLRQFSQVPGRSSHLMSGKAELGRVLVDVRLPAREQERVLLEESTKFRQKHDLHTKRLHFLWKPAKDAHAQCGCSGGCAFFGQADESGHSFVDLSVKMAELQLRAPDQQPGYLQSILDKDQSGIQLPSDQEPRAAMSPEARKLSNSSFHSANSQSLADPRLDNYATHLAKADVQLVEPEPPQFSYPGAVLDWTLQNENLIAQETSGFTGLRLLKREPPTRPNFSRTTSLEPTAETPPGDWARDPTHCYLSGNLGQQLQVLLTPLTLEAVEVVCAQLTQALTNRHPAIIPQNAYFGCAVNGHCQPLTTQPANASTTRLRLHLNLPKLSLTLFQSEPLMSLRRNTSQVQGFVTSVLAFTMNAPMIREENRSVELYKPVTSVARKASAFWENANNLTVSAIDSDLHSTLAYSCTIQSIHCQYLHLVQPRANSAPVTTTSSAPVYTTNWDEVATVPGSVLRPLFDLDLPCVEAKLCPHLAPPPASRPMERAHSQPPQGSHEETAKSKLSDKILSLNIDIAPLSMTSVLGKPIESRAAFTELTVHEVVAPTLNAWFRAGRGLAKQLERLVEDVELYNDLSFIKVLADALDWRDEQVSEKTSRMQENRRNWKLFNSCPSCKLSLALLRYVSRNSDIVCLDYYLDILLALDDLGEKRARKAAAISLLSHWQTLICSQIQLLENQRAHRYCYVMEKSPPASKVATLEPGAPPPGHTPPPAAPPADTNQKRPLLTQSATADALFYGYTPVAEPSGPSAPRSRPTTPPPPTAVKLATPVRVSGHRRQGSNATVTGFQPGHRRGPSTATQGTASHAAEAAPRKEDLYHWILRAQKEYKQRRDVAPKKEPDERSAHEVNPMELRLSVFFWPYYAAHRLEATAADALRPLANTSLLLGLRLQALKLDVVERRVLHTAADSAAAVLGSVTHHLAAIDSVELNGALACQVGLDDVKLRPALVEINTNYDCKVQSVRVVASLASVCLVNDLAMALHACVSSNTGPETPKLAPNETFRSRLPSSAIDNMSEFYWVAGVLDKLNDYQRYVSRSHHRVCRVLFNTQGQLNLKSVLLECMLTDLFISLTMLRVQPSHEHHWVWEQESGVAPTTTRRPTTTSNKPTTTTDRARLTDLAVLDIKRGSLVLTEHRSQRNQTAETKQILNCTLKQSTAKFESTNLDSIPHRKLVVQLGELAGDLPMHAQSVHDVILRHGPKLRDQLYRIVAQQPQYFPDLQPAPQQLLVDTTLGSAMDSTSTLLAEKQQNPFEMTYELVLTSVELDAQLLPSLRTKYRLSAADASGRIGELSQFQAKVVDHQVCFFVVQSSQPSEVEKPAPSALETFTLPLPYIKAAGQFKPSPGKDVLSPNPLLLYKDAGYHDVTVTMGPMEHTFSTDLLNQILFAEQSFRSELTFLLERLSVERPVHENTSPLPLLSGNSKPIFFDLTFRGEGAPWIQLTASTPTATAVRFTIDGPTAVISNRLLLSAASAAAPPDHAGQSAARERLLGRAKVQLNVKLGQLCKSAMYEEAKEELQEYATFMTQISAQNEEVTQGALHNYIVILNRPIVLIKATAIDKALLLWINYRNTYNYWREERNKVVTQQRQQQQHPNAEPAPAQQPQRHAQSAPTASAPSAADMNMNLSLSIQGGLYVCMPLFSEDINDNMAALLISLQKSDVSVCVKKELSCHAKFEAFKITFIDTFDEHSLSNSWLQENTGDSIHSNFVFFPEGSYYFCSSANPPAHEKANAKWILSIQSEMKGMIIDFDSRIGKLTNQCVRTLSSFTGGDEAPVDTESVSSSVPKPPDGGDRAPSADALPALAHEDGARDMRFDEMDQLVGREDRIRWLERKMHEQSLLVTDLINCAASEYHIELERRKLRILELARFKQFRQTMLEKLKRKVEPKTGDSRTHRLAAQPPTLAEPQPTVAVGESVDMDIDVQVKIETGHCVLRANQPSTSGAAPQRTLAKRLSAKDLRSKPSVASPVTTLQIPSLDAKAFYTSDDARSTAAAALRQRFGAKRASRTKCFYLSLELAKMLEPTLVTPALADFLEQVVEPLPDDLFESSARSEADAARSDAADSNALPIVVLDTSGLPLDVFFHMTVYSSVLRFEGQQQQRSSSAADCLLTLPSLTLMASTRQPNDALPSVAGIYVSATLSNFDLSIYSPHQQASSHDALAVKLDKYAITASRTKCPTSGEDEKNNVKLVIVSNVGRADFNYDMRRLGELLSFPKPWYRKKLFQRIFFGEQSLQRKSSASSTHSAANAAARPPRRRPSAQEPPAGRPSPRATASDWAASVDFSIQWSELNVNAQMSNTMGNTAWLVRHGILRGHVMLDSKRQKSISVGFQLAHSQLSAQGGAISGDIAVNNLLIAMRHTMFAEKPPESAAKLKLDGVECRVEWMSRPIFIGRFVRPRLVVADEWQSHSDSAGRVDEALCMLKVRGSWADLQMIITKNTTTDLIRIVHKLATFFNEQLQSSRMVWGEEMLLGRANDPAHKDNVSISSSDTSVSATTRTSDETPVNSLGEKTQSGTASAVALLWQRILDLVTDVQLKKKYLPLPTTADGVTLVGGVLEFEAQRITLACMNGEMSASSWALFHMRDASTLLAVKSKYAFIDAAHSELGVKTEHKFVFKLGAPHDTDSAHFTECKASVCRVQHTRNFLLRHNTSIELCLDAMIGDVLKQMRPFDAPGPAGDKRAAPARFTHNVLELFQFPALDSTLTTYQTSPVDLSSTYEMADVVESTFICEFHNAVYVQTDFNAQVGFLPELLKSYMLQEEKEKAFEASAASQPDPGADRPRASKDRRQYVCRQWTVDPKIRFIDRFKWNPPVIDDVLRKLQIFDHRTTIPKVMQRGVLDGTEQLVACILKLVVRQALRD